MQTVERTQRVFEIYDTRTGETVETGYTRREAAQSIAWCWNTGGDITHYAIRRDPRIAVPKWQRAAGLRLHARDASGT